LLWDDNQSTRIAGLQRRGGKRGAVCVSGGFARAGPCGGHYDRDLYWTGRAPDPARQRKRLQPGRAGSTCRSPEQACISRPGSRAGTRRPGCCAAETRLRVRLRRLPSRQDAAQPL